MRARCASFLPLPGNDTIHTQGGGEKYLADEFGAFLCYVVVEVLRPRRVPRLDAGGYRPFVADHQWMSAIKRGCPGRRCMTCWGGSAARVERAAAAVGGESARDVEGGDVVRPPMAEVKMTRIAPASRVLGVLATDVESCCLRKSARCSARRCASSGRADLRCNAGRGEGGGDRPSDGTSVSIRGAPPAQTPPRGRDVRP